MWCIWQHPDSPLFGKDKMATFERYFIEAKETHLEKKNPYYELLEKEAVVDEILKSSTAPEGAHIVNGHVPVKCKNGESPIKCNGKVLVIDGGFSRAYQKETELQGIPLSTTPMVLFWLPMSLLSRKRLRWKRKRYSFGLHGSETGDRTPSRWKYRYRHRIKRAGSRSGVAACSLQKQSGD